MTDEKESAERFQGQVVRREQARLDELTLLRKKREASQKLQVEMKRVAECREEVPWERTAELLQMGADAMEEQQELHSLADEYDEARTWLRKCGYEWSSAVEGLPRLVDMMKNMLTHREGIHSHLHAALTHLGVSEEWITELQSGHTDEFFRAFPNGVVAKTRQPDRDRRVPRYDTKPAAESEEKESEEMLLRRALHDMRTATSEVRDELARLLKLQVADEPEWADITTAVDALVVQGASQALALNSLRREIVGADEILLTIMGQSLSEDAGNDVVESAGAVATFVEQLRSSRNSRDTTIAELRRDVKRLQEGDDTEAGTWKGHYLDLAMACGVPRIVWGDARSPSVDAVSNFIGQVMPLHKLVVRYEELAKRVEALEPDESEATSKPKDATLEGVKLAPCPNCQTAMPEGLIFCAQCGSELGE